MTIQSPDKTFTIKKECKQCIDDVQRKFNKKSNKQWQSVLETQTKGFTLMYIFVV